MCVIYNLSDHFANSIIRLINTNLANYFKISKFYKGIFDCSSFTPVRVLTNRKIIRVSLDTNHGGENA